MSAPDPPTGSGVGPAGGAAPRRAGTALLRAVLHILFASWGLTVREAAAVLGGIPLRALLQWRERPEAAEIDPVLRYRLSCLLALHKVLRRGNPCTAGQTAWLRTPARDGRTPLAVLMDGRIGDIRALRQALWQEVAGDTKTSADSC